jgi:predicted glycogen debranching enzyme
MSIIRWAEETGVIDVRRLIRDENVAAVPREWLVTNGLGGYASATTSGEVTRRYHGFLIAALPPPFGRMIVLNDLGVEMERPDGSVVNVRREGRFIDFTLDHGLPSWRYDIDGFVIEMSVVLPSGQNIVHATFRVLGDGHVRLRLRPLINFRALEAAASEPSADAYVLSAQAQRYEITAGVDFPTLRMTAAGCANATFTADGGKSRECFFETEAERGYDARSWTWSPGYFTGEIHKDCSLTLIAATEPWHTVMALEPDAALTFECERRRRLVALAGDLGRCGVAAELILAADAFVITPAGRIADAARARAEGDEIRTVIAGYHWFSDWGRDTMISLEGLTLSTGRPLEARWILRTFAHYIRDGLIPNMFPEGQNSGLYHTADATLWFFHALNRYLKQSKDHTTLMLLLPTLKQVVQHHLEGTRFGIKVDPEDGLLSQGAEGYQLTWMDAKVGDWVVTPRRGKTVEINALWYNALRLLQEWLVEVDDVSAADSVGMAADKACGSFNRRFWHERGGYLYDIVDGENGDDASFRPNQILAISLDHPVLDSIRWNAVVTETRERLLTPVGLRSLAPGEPDYKPRYYGDLRARDAAYHQGTVWAWLIGPFIDAWLRVYPEDIEGARRLLAGFGPHLAEAGIGSISEVFDAEPPFTPGGCIAQAWSVAEVLRCLLKTGQPSTDTNAR